MASHFQDRQRILVSQEAARIIVDEGIKDYQLAKRKAAERLRIDDRRRLPRNTEIEQAVLERHRLFRADTQPDHLKTLRQAALNAMRLLGAFKPRLVGSVLNGAASKHADVNLHLFADAVEDVLFLLMDKNIPYRSLERRLRHYDEVRYHPALRLAIDGVEIEAVVLPPKSLRHPPLSPVDGKPMERAGFDEVERLVDFDAEAQRRGDVPL